MIIKSDKILDLLDALNMTICRPICFPAVYQLPARKYRVVLCQLGYDGYLKSVTSYSKSRYSGEHTYIRTLKEDELDEKL